MTTKPKHNDLGIDWDVTKMSTRGQVVIPEAIRNAAKLNKGDIFTVRLEGKKIVLRKLVRCD